MSLIAPVPARRPSAGQKRQMDRRFGMFLHFGVNIFGNVEWSDDGIAALSYQPTAIDADQWVRTAWQAGMNYVVVITKHHDGFCLWDTHTTDYSVRCSGNTTDVVAALAAACKKYGLALGLYYSSWDRSEPSYTRDFAGEYIPYMQAQLTELMDGRYGPIAELWLDGGWDKARSQWRLEELYDLVKRLQPECQIGINHTVGVDTDTAGGPDERYLPVRCRNGDPLRMFPCDFRLWDPHPCRPDDAKLYTFGGETYYLPFEMTVCSREGFSWFYSNIYEQNPLLDTEQVVHQCRDAWQAGNPVVINLPPDVRGRLVQADVEHLLEIARRLGVRRE